MERYLETPLWLLSSVLFIALLAAREAGYWLAKRYGPPHADDRDEFAMTSVLGLFALFIGFTFSIALGKFEERRQLVIDEANAIGTTWLRTSLLDEPGRDSLRTLLREYVDARVIYGEATNVATERVARQRSEALQARLWQAMTVATASFRDSPRASLLVTTLNESIDLAATRFAERESHVPPRILRLLGIFALVTAGLVGFHRGGQRRTTTLFFALLTLAIALVLDLDRPTTGMARVSQQPMLDLQQAMRMP